KARIFVDIRPEMTGLDTYDRRTLDDRVMTAIRSGCRVTGGQLAAGFWLTHGNAGWSGAALAGALYDGARHCQAAALSLDPLLASRDGCDQRAGDIIRWGLRTGFLTAADNS